MFLLVLTNYIVAVALFDVVFSVVKLPSCSLQQISCFFWDDTFNLLLDTGLTLDAHLGGSLGGASFLLIFQWPVGGPKGFTGHFLWMDVEGEGHLQSVEGSRNNCHCSCHSRHCRYRHKDYLW